MKTMFLQVLDCGRSTVPSLEAGRLVKRWLAGHWIPAVFPSFETHTTWPILLHSGHSTWSPTFTMFLFPPSFWYLRRISSGISFSTCRWFAQMICIFCSFSLNLLSAYTIPFTSCFVLLLKRSNYSIGLAQGIRETLQIKVCWRTYKRMG